MAGRFAQGIAARLAQGLGHIGARALASGAQSIARDLSSEAERVKSTFERFAGRIDEVLERPVEHRTPPSRRP